MKLSKIALALLCATTLAFAACGKKDEEKKGEETPAAKAAGDNTAAATDKPALPEKTEAAAAEDDEAAGDDDDSAGGDTPVTEKDMEEAMSMMKDMVKAIEANKEDCKAMAGALDKVFADNKALMEKAKTFRNDPAAQKLFEEKYKDEMQGIMMGMMGGMQKCGSDPAVMEAMKKMQ